MTDFCPVATLKIAKSPVCLSCVVQILSVSDLASETALNTILIGILK